MRHRHHMCNLCAFVSREELRISNLSQWHIYREVFKQRVITNSTKVAAPIPNTTKLKSNHIEKLQQIISKMTIMSLMKEVTALPLSLGVCKWELEYAYEFMGHTNNSREAFYIKEKMVIYMKR